MSSKKKAALPKTKPVAPMPKVKKAKECKCEELKAEVAELKRLFRAIIDDYDYPQTIPRNSRHWNSKYAAYHRGLVLGSFSAEIEDMDKIKTILGEKTDDRKLS